MELSNIRGQQTTSSHNPLQRHPLFFYFLIAYTVTWSVGFLFIVFLHIPLHLWLLLPMIAGPTVSAFIMTAVTEGKAGVGRLLRGYMLWRVGLPWYLLVLIGMPALLLLSILVLPGGMAVVRHQLLMPVYPVGFILALFLGGALFEEPGWRGFALPRLQQRFGPLWGTFILGVLWGFWHLPLYFVPGFNGAGTDFVGILLPFGEFVISALAMSVLFTWVFNNTRGSLLLAILLHASLDAVVPTFASSLIFLMVYVLIVVVALLIIVATRGRLSYERYQRETGFPASSAVMEQEPVSRSTSA
jgi:membrane protease YdiL (CAAX protease family)